MSAASLLDEVMIADRTGLSYLDSALIGDREAWDCPLRAEMAAAGLSVRAFARVLALGVPAAALAQLCGAGDLAACHVALSRDGKWFELEGPDPRLLLAVREQGVVVDIAALATHAPDQWALRSGMGWCLGYDAWLDCEIGWKHELRVHTTPLAWLQAGCEGVAILDWDVGVSHLRGLGDHVQLRCDRGAGKRLTALLQHGGIPRVKETGLPPVRRAA